MDSPSWEVRNNGIKLIGMISWHEKLDYIMECIKVRSPRNVGIIRRNACTALGDIGNYEDKVIETLLFALKDPYWEVQVAALDTLSLSPRKQQEIEQSIHKRYLRMDVDYTNYKAFYRRCNFEVLMNLPLALGGMGSDDLSVAAVMCLLEHPNWLIRDAALRGMGSLYQRRIISEKQLQDALRNMDLSCIFFKPRFSIQATYNQVLELMHPKEGKDTTPMETTTGD